MNRSKKKKERKPEETEQDEFFSFFLFFFFSKSFPWGLTLVPDQVFDDEPVALVASKLMCLQLPRAGPLRRVLHQCWEKNERGKTKEVRLEKKGAGNGEKRKRRKKGEQRESMNRWQERRETRRSMLWDRPAWGAARR